MARRGATIVVALATLVAGCRAGTRDPNPEAAPPPGSARPPPSPSPSPTPNSIVLSASGDILIHEGVANRARRYAGSVGGFDFAPMFDLVKPILSASDAALCHLESPISRDNRNLAYYPRFNVPREIGAAVAGAGFDICSTASNHSIDHGPESVIGMLEVLDASKIAHTGTGRNPEEAVRPARINVKGIETAFLSYTFGLNGLTLPKDREWMVNRIDSARILADAQAARTAGAEFISVSLHWGTEYQSKPSDQQVSLGKQLLSSPAVDLVLGHHTHVVQPMTKIGEKFLVYGMGNFISRQSAACCPAPTQDGVVVHLLIEEVSGGAVVRRLTYTPTWVEQGALRIVPVAQAIDDPATPADIRNALRISWRRTTEAINALGARELGIVPAAEPRL